MPSPSLDEVLYDRLARIKGGHYISNFTSPLAVVSRPQKANARRAPVALPPPQNLIQRVQATIHPAVPPDIVDPTVAQQSGSAKACDPSRCTCHGTYITSSIDQHRLGAF